MKIPTFEEAKQALIEKRGTPLDKFIDEWAPPGSDYADKFREALQELLEWHIEHEAALTAKTLRPPPGPPVNPFHYFWDEASRTYVKRK